MKQDDYELYSDGHSYEADALVVQSFEPQARRIRDFLEPHADSVVISRSFSGLSEHMENRGGYQSLMDTYDIVVADVGRNPERVEDMYWSDAVAVLHTNGPLEKKLERADIPVSGDQVDGDTDYLYIEGVFCAFEESIDDDAAREMASYLERPLKETGTL
jgi:hypothetical protein